MDREPAPHPDEPPAPRPAGELRTILWNLAGLLLFVALYGLWFLLYTDWLAAIGGLLTLTGALAWITLLVELISAPRKEQIQQAFERRVLLDRSLWKRLALAGLPLLVLTAGTGTIEVSSYRDDQARSLRIYRAAARAGAPPLREASLPARSSRKFLVWGYGTLHVKLTGLPTLELRPGIFRPRVVKTPDDFTRTPVLLVQPTPPLSDYAARLGTLELVIQRGGEPLAGPMPFGGRAVWVGCDRDVAIPDWIYRRWQSREPVPWLPAVDVDPPVTLRAGDELTLRLDIRDGAELRPYTDELAHVVRSPYGPRDFVQQVVLSLPGEDPDAGGLR